MGSSNWSDDFYNDRKALRASTGASTFAHTDAVKSGKATATHETMDPAKMKGGVREARDSTEHPESNPVYVGLDVTGSMSSVPRTVQGKLKELMGLLLTKGYLSDPAICVSGIGDAEMSDKAPLQVGQFEAGIEIENDITNLYLEGGGGGNNQESYDLALYFLARCVKTDAWEKRQKKGYAFIICDERLPTTCKATIVEKVFGVKPEKDIPVANLVKEVLEKWELYCIVPNNTHNYKTSLQDSWKSVLHERVIFLDDPSTVVETIASCIGLLEENTDLHSLVGDLKDVSNVSDSAASAVTRALSKVSGSSMTKFSGTGLTTL